MIETPPLTLRYFDCRGRVQAIRYYLRSRNLSFIDARIPLREGFAAWQQVKPDQRLTGPFLKLPVLHWGELLLAETSVIHDWLHRKLGDEAALSEQENLQHAMLSSSCRSELMVPHAMLVYQDVMYPGTELAATVQGTRKRIEDNLKTLENALRQWQWFEKLQSRHLMLADCVLWEELDKAHILFGEHLEWSAMPALRDFLHKGPAAGLLRRMLSEHPGQMTGRPQEAEALARIHAALNAGK